jgi:hypothetical protein
MARRSGGIYESLCRVLSGKKKTQALKKWQNYFERNAARMQYERFRQAAVPCGSGCVESTIRRVINLRLKAPGTFWTQDMAECFLFLRSQLLSGRWDTFIHNVARLTRQWIEPLPQLNNLEGSRLFPLVFTECHLLNWRSIPR